MMKKIPLFVLLFASLTGLSAQAEESELNQALNKTKEGALELFGIAKEKGTEIGSDLLDKGAELGAQAKERAQDSGEIFMDKMQQIGSASKDLAEKGANSLKGLGCELSDATCLENAEKAEDDVLDQSI